MTQASLTSRGPRGWDRMVAQLNAAPDLATFHRGMLDLQCKIVAAEYGALWVLSPDGKPTPVETWPVKLAQAPNDAPLMNLLGQAAKSGFERQAGHILKAAPDATQTNGELGAHVFVTILRVKGQVAAVCTVVAECRDAQVIQSTTPLRELAAGLYEGFFAKQEAIKREADGQQVRQALAILAVSQEADGFHGACLNLVNELARQLKCDRVSLGWLRGQSIRLVAMSDTEYLKRKSEDVGTLELAMAECLDQQQPVVYPVPAGAEPLLQNAVIHAHKKLVGTSGRHAISLPLRQRDEWIGVLLIEREGTLEPSLIQYVQLIADVVAPHLDDRRQGDQWLYVHGWRSIEYASSYVVGPKHVAWKLGAVAAIAVIAFCIFGSWDYKISSPFVFEAESQRIIPAPFEGQLRSVNVRPGDQVKAGQVLATFDTSELSLKLIESQTRLKMAELEYNKNQYDLEGKQAEALEAEADIKKEKADVDLLQYEVDRATVKSPLTGVVLSGDLLDKIGTVLKQGDQMFEVAPVNDLVAVIHVSETDIDQIRLKGENGTLGPADRYTGILATKSEPEQSFNFQVTRIVPSASPSNSINSFEVRARLDDSAPWLRPGMEGLAKIEIGSKPLWWILTHRVSDTVRLWAWTWL